MTNLLISKPYINVYKVWVYISIYSLHNDFILHLFFSILKITETPQWLYLIHIIHLMKTNPCKALNYFPSVASRVCAELNLLYHRVLENDLYDYAHEKRVITVVWKCGLCACNKFKIDFSSNLWTWWVGSKAVTPAYS